MIESMPYFLSALDEYHIGPCINPKYASTKVKDMSIFFFSFFFLFFFSSISLNSTD